MKEKLKLLYPAVDADIIDIVYENAEAFILDYCNIEEVPTLLEGVILQMCKEDINKMYAEGFDSESSGGGNINYITDYSETVYKRLRKHKKIRTI